MAKRIAKSIDHPDGTRTCTDCGARKPLDDFAKASTGTGGRRSDCKPCRSEKMRAWYAANRERQLDKERKRRVENADAIRARDQIRFERDRDRRAEWAAIRSARRRARIAGGPVDRGVTRSNLRQQYGDRCFYCGVEMAFVRLRSGEAMPANLATLEHVVPIALGGTHTWDNVVLACWSCNCSKRHSLPSEWSPRLPTGTSVPS